MNWDKISELCQCVAILAMVANDLLLQNRIRRLEEETRDIEVDVMAEGLKKALLQLRKEKEAKNEDLKEDH